MRKAQEEKVPQESSFNIFRVVTCVKELMDGLLKFRKKNERMNGNFSNIVLRKAKFDSMVT